MENIKTIKLQETPDQVALVKAMGSKKASVAREAAEVFADAISPVIKEVLKTAGTVAKIYDDFEYDEDADPSIPLDLFYNEGTGYVQVWSQSQAGGLPSSQVEGIKEMKFMTYRLDSAFSFNKKYARQNRLDVISKSMNKMLQEVLIKQERNGWAVILKALAEGYTKTVNGGTLINTIAATTSNVFQLVDLSNLMVRIKRINESFSGNTPIQPFTNGPTDLYLSPEIKAQIRAFAFNPIDTSAANTKQNLPEALRMEIWNGGGMQSIMGVNLNEMIEFGAGQKYNTLFGSFVAASTVPGTSGGFWSTSLDEIMVAIDNSRKTFLRPLVRQSESGGTFTVLPDGQWDTFGSRVEKAGFYGWLEEGRICTDSRTCVGIVI